MQSHVVLRMADIMKAVGIVAEYNPLHNGHVYHISRSRELSGADAVVVAMSGDYVQRGEPAILDKWTRTAHALNCGADLVVEIPVLHCLGNAGQYASAAVRILESTGVVSHISFGSECGDTAVLAAIAKVLRDKEGELAESISSLRSRGLSYPAAREASYAELRGRMLDADPAADPEILREIRILSSPNDILSLEYIQAMRAAEPVAVRREGAGYGDSYDDKNVYQSASALRTQVMSGHDISRYVPECSCTDLTEQHITGPDTDGWWNTLRYSLMSQDEAQLEDCPSGGEGLANLLKDAVNAPDAVSWSSFIRKIKSRRYTYTRLSRLCMQSVLGITRSRYAGLEPGYIRVLGFNDTGRQLLAGMKNEEISSLPVITNINKEEGMLSEEAKRLLALDVHAADIYNLLTGRDVYACSDHRHMPVILH